jgi:predicted RNA binding protein YcfA (HicA-like mRNA interferase family)
MERAILHLGFRLVRQKGSHAFYRHPDGRTMQSPTLHEKQARDFREFSIVVSLN